LAGLAAIADTEQLPLEDALGRVTAADCVSLVDLPLFRNSQMDGFAVASADLAAGRVTLPIADDIPAGRVDAAPRSRGTAARIMTGAVVPPGADCVVPVERVTVEPAASGNIVGGAVSFAEPAMAGDFVREPGSDIRSG